MRIVLALVAGVLAAIVYGAVRWKVGTGELRARLEASRVPMGPRVVDFGELERLPAPVQRYFRVVLNEGQPMVAGVRLRHRGHVQPGRSDRPVEAVQVRSEGRNPAPGVRLDGRVVMVPGVSVRVHDAYVAGEGILHASLLGLFSLVNLHGTLADGTIRPTMLFAFTEEGLIETVRAEARGGETVGGQIVPTPWHGRFWSYEERGGMRVPLVRAGR